MPFPSPGDLPNPEIEPRSPALQIDSLPTEPQGKPHTTDTVYKNRVPGGSVVKNPPQCRRHGGPEFDPWVAGGSPGEDNGNPLQYCCLENSMDRGAGGATVHGVAKSQTRLSDFTHSLRSITMNKASGDHGIPTELFQILKDDAIKVLD